MKSNKKKNVTQIIPPKKDEEQEVHKPSPEESYDELNNMTMVFELVKLCKEIYGVIEK